MKPFNLEEALSGKPVMLRNGEKAFIRYHETELPVRGDSRLIGFLEDGRQWSWNEDGNYVNPPGDYDYDIEGMWTETRIINGFEVPSPETTELEYGADYFLAAPTVEQLYLSGTWSNREADRYRLKRGLIFLRKECAITNAKAMIGIDPYSSTQCEPYEIGTYLPEQGGHLIGFIEGWGIIMPNTQFNDVQWSETFKIVDEINCTSERFADWRVPTKGELNLAWTNREKLKSLDMGSGNYWSSNRHEVIDAWFQNFENGIQRLGQYSERYKFRPVRTMRLNYRKINNEN